MDKVEGKRVLTWFHMFGDVPMPKLQRCLNGVRTDFQKNLESFIFKAVSCFATLKYRKKVTSRYFCNMSTWKVLQNHDLWVTIF